MSYEFAQRKSFPLLIVLSGPTCSGKDSVLRRLEERGAPLHFVVTATSRAPRADETPGKDYIFVSEDEFRTLMANDELLEHALVYDQYKGIPKRQISEAMRSGADVILRIDVQGAATIRTKCPEALLIFLMPGSEEELRRRLADRAADTAEQMTLRLKTAHAELGRIAEYDYAVVNPDGRLDETVDTILAIIRAEHARTNPRKAAL